METLTVDKTQQKTMQQPILVPPGGGEKTKHRRQSNFSQSEEQGHERSLFCYGVCYAAGKRCRSSCSRT